MRIAFYSPLPPGKSGIADYSAELLTALAEHCEIELIVDEGLRVAPELAPAEGEGLRFEGVARCPRHFGRRQRFPWRA